MNLLFQSYTKAAENQKIFWRILIELIRRLMMLMGDPSYTVEMRGKKMTLPFSHKLPIYIGRFPFYDALPSRISSHIRTVRGFLRMVDVGANVGDTIAACYNHHDDHFLAVEANPAFVKYLRLNTSNIQHLTLVQAFCHSGSSGQTSVSIDSSNGTATIREGHGLTLPRKTLDEIINENADFNDANFLKIDTDGNDFDIIKGAHAYISKSKPVILLECDIFDNSTYVSDLVDTMKFFDQVGYASMIVYDNYGNLFGVFDIKDFVGFKYSLFYQLVSQFGYFDLLILKPEDELFIRSEKVYFTEHITNPILKNAAKEALDL